MPILSEEPIEVPAREASIYDSWWLLNLNVASEVPNGPTLVRAVFRLSSLVDVVDPETNETKQVLSFYRDERGNTVDRVLDINDLFAMSKQSPEVGALIDTVIGTIGAIAKSQGIIK